MGRHGAFVVALVASGFGQARADEPPPPEGSYVYPGTETQQQPPAPTPAQPQPPAAHPILADGFTVDRHGVMLLGGFVFAQGERFQYAVVYLPLHLPVAPRLKVGLTGSVQYQRQIIPNADDLQVWAYYLRPLLQYDWRLPIASRLGDFAIAAEGGITWGQIQIKFPGEAFMPPGWQHLTGMSVHGDGAFQFLGHSGLVVSIQPIGIDVPLYTSDPPSGFTATTEIAYSFALAAGYRFR